MMEFIAIFTKKSQHVGLKAFKTCIIFYSYFSNSISRVYIQFKYKKA